MSNKKNKKNIFPFSNEIKVMKEEFKQMIDTMPDNEFIEMISFLMFSFEDCEDLWAEDEGWEDDAEKFYKKGINNISNFSINNDEDLPF